MKKVIIFKDADISNGESVVVYGVNLEVGEGDLVYIVGKVGTGKTSIIRTIIAENRLASGEGSVCGFDLTQMRTKDIPQLRRKLGVVFQDFQLLMDRSVEANLEFVLKATGWKDREAMDKRIADVLESVGMQTKAHKMPHQLSGGEQQRIAIARAILNSPEVIIADEPTGNLDAETADGILQLLMSINRSQGTAIVMVTHNRGIIEKYPGRIFETKNESCTEI
ncbi:MAG: ATP-binding cassette domain-containing protein [Bacteroidales bacterium]|nr:ATP-binding cassette domain-containing protein [Bacteroidales bacterium]MBR0084052.1 ATP-binding cassette domain-containing protein [Bacteroidales bacterium]MBR0292220.1 ATP-binding cassette domain-containing protein [Bacteroidales bacterium]